MNVLEGPEHQELNGILFNWLTNQHSCLKDFCNAIKKLRRAVNGSCTQSLKRENKGKDNEIV